MSRLTRDPAALTIETARAAVIAHHAFWSEAIDVNGADAVTIDGIPAVEVAVILPTGDEARWTVWRDAADGRLYGEH